MKKPQRPPPRQNQKQQQQRPTGNGGAGRQHVAHRASDPPPRTPPRGGSAVQRPEQQQTRAAPQRPATAPRTTAVATRPVAPPPAQYEPDDLDRLMMEDSGMGVSTAPEDNLVPSILVLQPLSPQVLDGPNQVEGAEAGDIYLRGVDTIVPGTEGFWFQPCEKYDKWMQFVPRDEGGGFVAAYDFDPGVCDRKTLPEGAEFDPDNRNRAYFPDSGNECVHYHFVAGFLWDNNGTALEYVIPFKGTGHTIARTWNTTRLRQRFPNGMPMPAAANLYHLTTTAKRNKKGQWYVFEIGAAVALRSEEAASIVGGDPLRAYQMGRSLAGAISTGEKVIGVDTDDLVVDADPDTGGVHYQEGDQGAEEAGL